MNKFDKLYNKIISESTDWQKMPSQEDMNMHIESLGIDSNDPLLNLKEGDYVEDKTQAWGTNDKKGQLCVVTNAIYPGFYEVKLAEMVNKGDEENQSWITTGKADEDALTKRIIINNIDDENGIALYSYSGIGDDSKIKSQANCFVLVGDLDEWLSSYHYDFNFSPYK